MFVFLAMDEREILRNEIRGFVDKWGQIGRYSQTQR